MRGIDDSKKGSKSLPVVAVKDLSVGKHDQLHCELLSPVSYIFSGTSKIL